MTILFFCGESPMNNRVPRARSGAWFLPGLVVQHLGELLQAGNDLRRLGKNGAGQFFGLIGPALRHLGEGHHDRERVVNGMFDLAEFLLQLREFFLGNGAAGLLGHDWFKSLENSGRCA
jgi:hypothetical protein